MFIYCITNLINDKKYIGLTIRPIKFRFTEHCKPSRNKLSVLSNAINKYGKENFKIELLHECSSKEELQTKEEYYIKLYNTMSPSGYNLTSGGESPTFTKEECLKRKLRRKNQSPPTPKGTKQSKEWIENRIKNRRKAVVGINLITNEMIEFESVNATCSKFGKWAYSAVSASCLSNKNAYGYKWKFKEQLTLEMKERK